MTASYSVSVDWQLAVVIYGRARRGPNCGFVLFCLQNAIGSSAVFNAVL